MIFNKDYDSSLWNIIVVDRENRKDLVDFYKCVSKNCSNICCYFQIDEDNALTITKTLRKEIGETQLFKLMIFPLTEKSVKQLDYFKGEWFGSIHNQEKIFVKKIN